MIPLFENEDVGSQRDRRLLVISYHFPPDGAVGAKRWEKFSHFAAARGWGLDVFMRGDLTGVDTEAARRSLPTGVRVFSVTTPVLWAERAELALWRALKGGPRAARGSVPSVSTAQAVRSAPRISSIPRADLRWALHTPRGWMRAYWAALDFAQIRAWGEEVVADAEAVFVQGVHRAVITSGPPFMSHDAGRRISQRHGIPFIMDMRDPWSHVERLAEAIASPAWTKLASRFETKAVAQASVIVANTEVARRQLSATYPTRTSDIVTVTNGGDEDDVLPPQRRGGRFSIAHAGTLYLDRDPRALFQAAAAVIRRLSLTPDDLTLDFIGEMEAVGGFPIEEVARAEGIEAYVRTGPARTHRGAMEFMAQATMLVTMSGSNMAAIPAKTFECVRFPVWVLALSAPDSATELLLRGTNADVAAPRDVDSIAEIIERRYHEHRSGVIPEPIGRDTRFSRAHQAGLFLDLLDRCVAGPKRH